MMEKRIQSPSSINTYLQCPRKYFYRYILKLPSKSNVYQVRGNITHNVLEKFFDINLQGIDLKNYETVLKKKIQELLIKEWLGAKEKLAEVELTKNEQIFYFEESMMMLFNWIDQFNSKIKSFDNLSFTERFEKLTPLREMHFSSEEHLVQGFIDAIEQREDGIYVMDYKTSSSFKIGPEYKLQLAIYAHLYKEKHGVLPKKVGIYFLRHKDKYLPVNEDLVKHAKEKIQFIHDNTTSKMIKDYNQNITRLCKWRTGQCEFYSICFEQKKIQEFTKEQTDKSETNQTTKQD